MDIPGIATLSIGLTALILALVESTSWGWGSAGIIGLLAAAAVGADRLHRGRAEVAPAPMVQFEFFKSRTFFGANVIAFIISFAMLAMFFLTALYIQNILGYSPLEAGVRFLPTTLMIVLIAPIAGRLADRIGPRPPMVVGLALTTLALFLQTRIDLTSGYTRPAAGVRPDGCRNGARDVADVHRRDERGARHQGRRRLGHPVDEPHGRRHVRRRAARHDLPDDEPQPADGQPRGLHISAAQKSAIADNIGQSATGARHSSPQIVQAAHDAFIHGFTGAMVLSVAVAGLGVVLAATLIQSVKRPVPEQAAQPEPASQAEATAEPIGV